MQALDDMRLNMAELTKENVYLIVLANMQHNRSNSSQTKQTATHTDRKARRRASVKFFLLGRQGCRSTYLFAYGVGIKKHKNLCKHYGPSLSDEQSAISFISNYADYNSMPLPGRMPNMKDYIVMMLPSVLLRLTEFFLLVRQVCRSTFHFAHGVGIKNKTKLSSGPVSRVHIGL